MTEIKPADVVKWLRQQATDYSAMADRIEGNSAGGLSSLIQGPVVTADKIKALLRVQGMRLADLENQFGVPKKQIEMIVRDPVSGLSIGDRGWIKIVGE